MPPRIVRAPVDLLTLDRGGDSIGRAVHHVHGGTIPGRHWGHPRVTVGPRHAASGIGVRRRVTDVR